jgi:hypothetical protein
MQLKGFSLFDVLAGHLTGQTTLYTGSSYTDSHQSELLNVSAGHLPGQITLDRGSIGRVSLQCEPSNVFEDYVKVQKSWHIGNS